MSLEVEQVTAGIGRGFVLQNFHQSYLGPEEFYSSDIATPLNIFLQAVTLASVGWPKW